MSGVRSGAITIRSWADLVPLFGSQIGVASDVWPWIVAHAAPRACSAPHADQDWNALTHQMIPPPSSDLEKLTERSASRAHLLAATALKFGQPLSVNDAECPVLSAGHLLALCLLPDPSNFLSAEQIPDARAKILDSLASARRPYGMDSARSELWRWNVLMGSTLAGELTATPSKPTRQELGRALDNAAAYWLKVGASCGPAVLTSIQNAKSFQERLTAWPHSELILKRVVASRVGPRAPSVEPRTVSDLILASSTIPLLTELGRPDTPVSPEAWRTWFARPTDDLMHIGSTRTALGMGTITPCRVVLFRRLAQEFSCTPLAGGEGKTLAHLLLMHRHPKDQVQLILDTLGSAAMTVRDDSGTTPLGVAADRLFKMSSARSHPSGAYARETLAELEQMVLLAAQKESSSPPEADLVPTRSRRL
jgi:hypothetical protein